MLKREIRRNMVKRAAEVPDVRQKRQPLIRSAILDYQAVLGRRPWRRPIREGGGGPSGPLLDLTKDGTFTRSSEASYLTSASTMAWAGVDERRVEDRGDGYSAYLNEGARTNLALYSEDFSNAVWGDAGTTGFVPNDAAAPDGDIEALSITGAAGMRAWQDVPEASVTDNANVTVTSWVRLASGSDGEFFLRANDKAGTDHDTATLTATSVWQRFSLTYNAGTGANDLRFFAIRRGGGVSESTFEVWGAQFEEGSFPSSYIRTSGASATRAGDVLALASFPPELLSGAFQITILSYGSGAELHADNSLGVLFAYDNDSVQGGDQIRWASGSTSGRDMTVEPGARTNPVEMSRHQPVTFTFDASAGTVQVSGATSGDGTYGGAGDAWEFNAGSGYVGSDNGAIPFAGRITNSVAV